ncbi:MAG: LTA synthase family protein [Coriobacteriales bacterium]|nr:LTA synthase family protein [Coriobacteriales bacterium]
MGCSFGLIPLVALVAEVALCAWYARSRTSFGNPVPVSSWVWVLPSALMLCFLTVWGLMGLVEGETLWYMGTLSCAGIAASGVLAQRRDDVWQLEGQQGARAQLAMRVGLVLVLLVFVLFAIEAPFNARLPFGGPSHFWLEMLFAGLLLLGCYLLAQRHTGACVIPVALLFFIGLAQYFIKRFKAAAILPTDLFALGTAAAVSNEYVFALDEHVLVGVACTAAAIAVLSLVRPKEAKSGGHTLARNLAGGAASLGLLCVLVLVPSYTDVYGVTMEYWYTLDYYQMQGFLPSFFAVMQDMPIHKPDGYTTEGAQQLTEEHARAYQSDAAEDPNNRQAQEQFSRLRPSVIAIMNESFSDLSVFDQMHAGYTGPHFLKEELTDALANGLLNVSVYGGGTCNSEFEFLTGNAMGFIGSGKYPYAIYDLSRVDALSAYFKALGYRTCALHPNYPANWKRDIVYPEFGFDTILFADDFGGMPDPSTDTQTPNEPHSEVFHSGVSDAATYDRILDILSQSDEPLFCFDVTMANHGSYEQDNIPHKYYGDYEPEDYEGEVSNHNLNEYLACIERSDQDLKALVEALRELDRPVVLVFFGDHQPSITKDYNDTWYANEDEDVHARREHVAYYTIWANYDVAGREQTSRQVDTSVDLLGIQMLDLIGAPPTDYQAAVLDITKQIPSLSLTGYQDASGTWYAPDDDGPAAQAYADLATIEYLNFAERI